MNKEMILRYMYYITNMCAGDSDRWNRCYESWSKYANFIGHDEYGSGMKLVSDFNKKYINKKRGKRGKQKGNA